MKHIIINFPNNGVSRPVNKATYRPLQEGRERRWPSGEPLDPTAQESRPSQAWPRVWWRLCWRWSREMGELSSERRTSHWLSESLHHPQDCKHRALNITVCVCELDLHVITSLIPIRNSFEEVETMYNVLRTIPSNTNSYGLTENQKTGQKWTLNRGNTLERECSCTSCTCLQINMHNLYLVLTCDPVEKGHCEHRTCDHWLLPEWSGLCQSPPVSGHVNNAPYHEYWW